MEVEEIGTAFGWDDVVDAIEKSAVSGEWYCYYYLSGEKKGER